MGGDVSFYGRLFDGGGGDDPRVGFHGGDGGFSSLTFLQ